MSKDKSKMKDRAMALCRAINRDPYAHNETGEGKAISFSGRGVHHGGRWVDQRLIDYCVAQGFATIKRVRKFGRSGRAGHNLFIVRTANG